MDAATGCPTGDKFFTAYEEFFDVYFQLVKGIVLKNGIASEDVEDVAMEIIAKFIEKGALEKYDPNMLHEIVNPHTPGPRYRKAKFNGMLTGFVRVYVMQHRDKQAVRHRREPFRLEHPAADGTEYGELVEATEPGIPELEVQLCIRRAVEAARFELWLRQEEAREAGKKVRDVLSCFDVIVKEGFEFGPIRRKAVAAKLGVSERIVGAMVREIKEVLSAELSAAGVALP